MAKQSSDEHDRKLLIKFVVVELVSLTKHLELLQTVVMRSTVFEDGQGEVHLGVSRGNLDRAKLLFGNYHDEKARVVERLLAIRHRLGAHRDLLAWDDMAHLWDSIDPSLVLPLQSAIARVFNVVKDLPIFEWSRQSENGGFEFVTPLVVSENGSA